MKLHKGHLGRIIAVFALALAPHFSPVQPTHAAGGWLSSDQAKYDNAVTKRKGTIAAQLGRPLGRRVVVILNPVEKLVRADGKLVDVYASTTLRPKELDCAININPRMRELQDPDWSVVVAHEVFHCFQFDIDSSESKWIIEGQAEWVGQVVAGPAPALAQPSWDKYLEHPEIPLFKRRYAAIGFYAHLEESCISPWKIFDAMLRASKAGDRSAYDAATSHCTSGSTEPFLDSWASGLFRDASHGHEWTTAGPGRPGPSMVNPVPYEIALATGHAAPVSAAPFTNGIYTLVSSADIVQVETVGHARLSDGNLDQVLHGQADFCTRTGGCGCPPGSAYQGPPLTPLAAHVDLALTGGPEGTKVTLTGQSLDGLCSKKPAPHPLGPGGSLPNPCKLVTLSDLEQIVGENPGAVDVTYGPSKKRDAPACEHLITGKVLSGAVLIVVERRPDMAYTGTGKAVTGLGDEAYLSAASDYANLLVAKGRLVILIQVTMGTRSTPIALAVGRKAISQL